MTKPHDTLPPDLAERTDPGTTPDGQPVEDETARILRGLRAMRDQPFQAPFVIPKQLAESSGADFAAHHAVHSPAPATKTEPPAPKIEIATDPGGSDPPRETPPWDVPTAVAGPPRKGAWAWWLVAAGLAVVLLILIVGAIRTLTPTSPSSAAPGPSVSVPSALVVSPPPASSAPPPEAPTFTSAPSSSPTPTLVPSSRPRGTVAPAPTKPASTSDIFHDLP